MFDGRRADLLHRALKLEAHQFKHALDAGLPEGAQAPDIGPPDADRGRAHAQRLDDVGATAEAAVDQDRHTAFDRLDDLRQRIDAGTAAVLAAPAMIGDDDTVD